MSRRRTLVAALAAALLPVLASHGRGPEPDPDPAPGRLIVRFEPVPAGHDAAAWRALPDVASARRLVKRPAPVGADGPHQLFVVDPGPGADVVAAAHVLSALPQVRYAEPDWPVRAAATLPNDPRFAEVWSLDNTGQTGGTPGADIDAPAAWDVTTGSSAVVVAVIDSGVDHRHPDLAPNMWVNPGESGMGRETDGIDNDGNGYVDDVHGYDFRLDDGDPMDAFGHGTHVAGTIAAVGDNGLGMTGVSWSSRIMALRFLGAGGGGWTSDAVEALHYAIDNGARITCNSWGGGGYSQALRDALVAARDAGVLFVAAAGNGGRDTDLGGAFYPAGYDVDCVLSVANTDHDDLLSPSSNRGATTVDLAAPGSEILSCYTPKVTLFSEDFQGAALPGVAGTQMTTAGAADFWGTIDAGGSNVTARGDVLAASPYQANSDGWLLTPVLDTTGLDGLWLSFRDKYEIELTDDAFVVEVWDGAAWVEVLRLSNPHNFDGYRTRIIDLEPYRNAAMQVRFGWLTDGDDNGYYGVELDDIVIGHLGTTYTDAYATLSGTSMAAPHVAGVAALLLADQPGRCLAELRQRLLWTGDPVPALAGLTVSGRRLNAAAALAAGPSLDVTAPDGAESWRLGTAHTITWTSFRCDQVDILLLEGGQVHAVLADDVFNAGAFTWVIPNDLPVGPDYRIRIDDGTMTDESAADFAIAAPIVQHVDASATGAGDGTSWADAYPELQSALAVAAADEQVWIAAGTYTPDYDAVGGTHTGDRAATFALVDGVQVYGGFPAGGGDGTFLARDPDAHVTVLSGDLNGDDAPDFTNIADNAWHVVTAGGTTRAARLDGFVVQGGHADGVSPDDIGAGLHCSGGDPTIVACDFRANRSASNGGAVLVEFGDPLFVDCVMEGNDAQVGACVFSQLASPTFLGCVFRGNTALTGGAMQIHYGETVMVNCLVEGNGARWAGGIGLLLGSLDARNCTIAGNSALLSNGGGGFRVQDAPLTLTNCIVRGNTMGAVSGETAQVTVHSGGPPVVSHSAVEGWTGAWGGVGNIGDDPLFVDAAAGDYRLDAASPCVDAGDTAAVPDDDHDLDGDANRAEPIPTDVSGAERVTDGDGVGGLAVDMGAHERPAGGPLCPADVTGDSAVDVQDLLAVLAAWGACAGCPEDTDASGTVDVGDLLAVLGAWGMCG